MLHRCRAKCSALQHKGMNLLDTSGNGAPAGCRQRWCWTRTLEGGGDILLLGEAADFHLQVRDHQPLQAVDAPDDVRSVDHHLRARRAAVSRGSVQGAVARARGAKTAARAAVGAYAVRPALAAAPAPPCLRLPNGGAPPRACPIAPAWHAARRACAGGPAGSTRAPGCCREYLR